MLSAEDFFIVDLFYTRLLTLFLLPQNHLLIFHTKVVYSTFSLKFCALYAFLLELSCYLTLEISRIYLGSSLMELSTFLATLYQSCLLFLLGCSCLHFTLFYTRFVSPFLLFHIDLPAVVPSYTTAAISQWRPASALPSVFINKLNKMNFIYKNGNCVKSK